MSYDHILFIGFGGPTKPEEIWPFLQNVTRGIPIPEERLRSVEQHYHDVGGRSPYNDHTFRLLEKLRLKLAEKSISLPVFVGMRNGHPFMRETLAEIKAKGLMRGIGIILAPHRSDASYEKYIRTVEEAKHSADVGRMEYHYLEPWFDHPGFIEAQADEIEKVIGPRKNTPVIFSAHSIPMEMAQKSKYAEEVMVSSEKVAKHLGLSNWRLAWQSRSPSAGSGRDGLPKPWLEPDVVSVIQRLKEEGASEGVLVPIGFLCDNVEVLFDLDIEAKQEAEKLGMIYRRASTVMDHPKFVAMFAALIGDRSQDLFPSSI